MNKNQRVVLFRSIIKILFVFVVISFLLWLGWNIFVVKELGVGNIIELKRIWVFGFPTLVLFYLLRLFSPYWMIFIKIFDFVFYSLLWFGWLKLIEWL